MSIIKDVDLTIEALIEQVIDVASARDGSTISNPVLDKLLEEIDLLIQENESFYHDAVENLDAYKVNQALASCFADGKMNWGRIVVVLTLLYVYAEQNGDCDKCRQMLKSVFTKELTKYAAQWIRARGGMRNYVDRCQHRLCTCLCIVIVICVAMMIKDVHH